MLQLIATSGATPAAAAALSPAQVRMVNYFPSAYAQQRFWTRWHPDVVDRDFGVIATTLHANTVRVFVPTDQFGYPNPTSTYTAELSQLVGIAHTHGLAVFLDLFAYRVPYSDMAGSKAWARAIIEPYSGDPRLAAIEVQNEINPADAAAITWAQAMIPYVRDLSSGVPVAISVCGCDNAGDLVQLHTELGGYQPDFYSFHYYAGRNASPSMWDADRTGEAQIQAVLGQAARAVAPLQLIIGETGMPTNLMGGYGERDRSDPVKEQVQSRWYAKVNAAAAAVGLPPAAPWDYIDATFQVGDTTNRFWGIFRADGSAKPARAVIASAFAR